MTLEAAIAAFIRTGEGDREALALSAFALQLATNPTLAAMFGPARPARLLDIPSVPVSLFKELDLGPKPPLASDALFRTSGTTGQVRGVHRARDTRLYDLGAVLHANARVPDRPTRIVSLCPAEPDSSLGHMLGLFGMVEQCFSDGAVHADTWKCISDVSRTAPIFLTTTAFALDALLAMPGRGTLDERSVVMVTGGFKGRTTRLDPPGLYRALPARLGSPRVVGEYGMTELSSQLWSDPVPSGEVPGEFIAPPWLAVYAVDPQTGTPVEGEGLLRFVDLANLGSVLAVETQDLGRVSHHVAGDRVTLLGRLEGAELRGCSLRVNG